MRREFSAGGVVVRRLRGEWVVALIRPAGQPAGAWMLPKGQIEPGETAQEAALREITEETGVSGAPLAALGRIEYWFRHEGERVLKTVSFFLVGYRGGALGRLPPGSEREVAQVRWFPLVEAPALLAYRGEQETAGRALELLRDGQDV